MKKNREYYLSLPYSYSIEWSDSDNCYLGSILELEENMTCGQTRSETMRNLDEALVAYIQTSLENNFDIPEPLKMKDYQGTIIYKTSNKQHYYIVTYAKKKGISVNEFIDKAVYDKLHSKQYI